MSYFKDPEDVDERTPEYDLTVNDHGYDPMQDDAIFRGVATDPYFDPKCVPARYMSIQAIPPGHALEITQAEEPTVTVTEGGTVTHLPLEVDLVLPKGGSIRPDPRNMARRSAKRR